MLSDCQEWRKSVEGVGVDELYQEIDPFDVSHSDALVIDESPCCQYPERQAVFECWPMWFHKVFFPVLCGDAVILSSIFNRPIRLGACCWHFLNRSQCGVHQLQKGRPLNVHYFGNMDLPKLYEACTPERHWKSVLVNCESVRYVNIERTAYTWIRS